MCKLFADALFEGELMYQNWISKLGISGRPRNMKSMAPFGGHFRDLLYRTKEHGPNRKTLDPLLHV